MKEVCSRLEQALVKQELCEVRLLLEINNLLFEEHGIALPGLYKAGAPVVPDRALATLETRTDTIPAQSLFADWGDEKLLAG